MHELFNIAESKKENMSFLSVMLEHNGFVKNVMNAAAAGLMLSLDESTICRKVCVLLQFLRFVHLKITKQLM